MCIIILMVEENDSRLNTLSNKLLIVQRARSARLDKESHTGRMICIHMYRLRVGY